MICRACKTDYQSTNQHSACPSCGELTGTDSDREMNETHKSVVKWYTDWHTATAESRKRAELARDYYDGNQWTAAELETLRKRGQPATVINRIFKKINYLLGDEVVNRSDPKAEPRTPAHSEEVNAVTDALRYVNDDQDFGHISSKTYENALIEGYGGCVVETEVRGEERTIAADSSSEEIAPGSMEYRSVEVMQDERRPEVRIRHVPWDRLWYDPHGRESDFSDASYLGTSTWMDYSDAVHEYRERQDDIGDVASNFEEVLNTTMTAGGNESDTVSDKPLKWSSPERKRVMVLECYYKKGDVWYTCHFTKAGWIIPPRPTGLINEEGRDVCPIVMFSAFVDREGNRYGLVHNMIGPQDEVNKRRSKALHLLSVRQVFAEDGAVLRPDEARHELAKPDGWVDLQPGALAGGKFQVNPGMELSAGHLQLSQEAKAEIDAVGPDMPMLTGSNDQSGRALMLQQQIGNRELARIIDNHKRWRRRVFEQVWFRIRQTWTAEKWFRVRDDSERTGFRFIAVNKPTTKAQRAQEFMQSGASPMDALKNVGVGEEAMQKAAQMVEQQVNMAMQQAQMQGMQAQMPPQEALQQMAIEMVMQSPELQAPFVANDIAKLKIDIVITESPDVAVVQHEELQQLREVMQSVISSGAAQPPLVSKMMELIIEASQLRNKKKLLDMLRAPPDPQQAQMQKMLQDIQTQLQQLSVAKMQADIAVDQTQAQLNAARAQKEQVAASVEPQKVGAEAQRDTALAMQHAVNAGDKMGGLVGGVPR